MKNIGVVGLGTLGSAVSKVLLSDALVVHGYDIDPAKATAARDAGVTIHNSPAEVAAASDIVLLSLPNSDIVREVCLGDGGIANCGKPNLLVVDTTSGYSETTIEVAAELKKAGLRMIDSPITGEAGGGAPMAPQRALTFIVGGEDQDIDDAVPLLERLSRYILRVGPLGSGHVVKMVNNMAGAVSIIAAIEGLLVAAKHGIDIRKTLAVMANGTGLTTLSQHPQLLESRNGGFFVGLMTKDLRHMSKLARRANVPLLIGDVVFHLFEHFTNQIGFNADVTGIIDAMEASVGTKLVMSPAQDKDDSLTDQGSHNLAGFKVGIIGLGHVGEAVARLLKEDGLEVYGYDLDAEKSQIAADFGVKVCASPREVNDQVELLLLSLPQSEVVREVCFGPEGVQSSDKNPLIVDLTSGYPTDSREIAAELQKSGQDYIDAAITGLTGGARAVPERVLTLIVGGEKSHIEKAKPVLSRFSSHIYHVGPLGSGQIVKMINNMVCSVVGIGTMEGFLLAAKHGINVQLAAEVLAKGTGNSIWANMGPALVPNPTPGGFYLGLMTKDLRHMSRLSMETGVPNLIGDLTYHLYELMVRELGYYGDVIEQIKVLQKWAGVNLDGTPNTL